MFDPMTLVPHSARRAFLIAAGAVVLATASAGTALANFEYQLVNPSGGNEGVSTYVVGEYDVGKHACGIQFYINRRSQTRVDAHFTQTGGLQRTSDRQIVCRWGSW